jgi:RNA polymerase sigma factor (sigma-70 family)
MAFPQPATAPAASSLRPRLPAALLARRARQGDERAFAEIFQRYSAELYRFCLAILRRHEEAEDAVAATMSAALRALPGERREIDLRAWLFRVARNESISIIRARTTPLDPAEMPEATSASAEQEAGLRERLRHLVADLSALPERQRSALLMRELSGLELEEIAVALECSPQAARQTVYEARVALGELEMGRGMSCGEVRRSVSAGDRRRLRGRRVRSHLRACSGCRDFATAIETRREDLAALFPLPAAAAAGGLLAALGGGASGGSAAGSIAGAGAVKGASVAAAVVLGAGAAGLTGAVDLPGFGQGTGSADSTGSAGSTAGTVDERGQRNAPSRVAKSGPAAGLRDGRRDGRSANARPAGERGSDRGARRGRPAQPGGGKAAGPQTPGNSAATPAAVSPGTPASPSGRGSAGAGEGPRGPAVAPPAPPNRPVQPPAAGAAEPAKPTLPPKPPQAGAGEPAPAPAP